MNFDLDSGTNVTEVGIHLSYKCTAECDHCCFSSNPRINQRLDRDVAERVVDEICSLGYISLIGFTGGECMIYRDDVLELASRIKEHGVQCSVATNAFWATDADTAEKYLRDMTAHGISLAIVSASPYHQQHVKIENIEHFIGAARKVDLDFRVTLTLPVDAADETTTAFNARIFKMALGNKIQMGRLDLTGRAKDLLLGARTTALEDFPPCGEAFHTSVHPDGTVWPCCAPAISRCFTDNKARNLLYLGNVLETSMADIIKRHERSIVFKLLRIVGPWGLAQLSSDLRCTPPAMPGRFHSGCVACTYLAERLGESLLGQIPADDEARLMESLRESWRMRCSLFAKP
jgi:MoaA/NifB/PqqE/SkfB family radical SAM enzyme